MNKSHIMIGHAWTEVKINNKWYLCDPTFELSTGCYRYFNCGTDLFALDHLVE